MLKPQDLRVGNWYTSTKWQLPVMCQLSDIAEIHHRLEGAEEQYADVDEIFQPIPLTAEWLEKFGFYEKYKSVHSHWSKGGVGIEQASDQDDDGYTIHPAPQEFFYQWNFNIPFVHTLQNLYHSLTGEELTINL